MLVLDPPVLIPYYDAAILDPNGEAQIETLPTLEGTDSVTLNSERCIYDRSGEPIKYSFSLSSSRMPEMRRIERVYISHPRQIFSVFEILRQVIRSRTLLDSVFHRRFQSSPIKGTAPSLSTFLHSSKPAKQPNSMSFRVEAPYGKLPRISLLLPTIDKSVADCKLSCFVFEIGRNGVVKMISSSVNEESNYSGKQELEAGLVNVVDIAEDLGIIGHWLREQIQ